MLEERAPVALADQAPRPEAAGWGWREVGATLALTVGAALALGLVTRGVVAALGLEVGRSLVSPALYLVGVGIYLAAVAGVYLFAARRAGWGALGLRAAPWSNFALVTPLFILELVALALVNSLVGLLAGGFENPQANAGRLEIDVDCGCVQQEKRARSFRCARFTHLHPESVR